MDEQRFCARRRAGPRAGRSRKSSSGIPTGARWAACKRVLGDSKDVEVQRRTDSIPCVRWNLGGWAGLGWEKGGLEWVALEKYSLVLTQLQKFYIRH